MNQFKPKLTLDQPATYQIKVPGHLDASWLDCTENISINFEENNPPLTTLTGTIDQAALQGILRRLYSFGLPLISVVWIKGGNVTES